MVTWAIAVPKGRGRREGGRKKSKCAFRARNIVEEHKTKSWKRERKRDLLLQMVVKSVFN